MFIDSLHIENFKGFSNPIQIAGLVNKNLLVFGENGSGKSSLYEALRLIFYYKKLDKQVTLPAANPAEELILRNRWLSKYIHNGKPSFDLKMNGTNYNTVTTANVEVYMLSSRDVHLQQSEISMLQLLQNLDYPDFPADFLQRNAQFIVQNINDILPTDFCENLSLSLDGSNAYKVILKDNVSNLSKVNDLNIFFNEARLSLIVMLIKLNVALLLQQTSKDQILILDDVISSLDMANRSFIINYILKNFTNFQKIILTHNASYFNLFRTIIDLHDKDNWVEKSLIISKDEIELGDLDLIGHNGATKLKMEIDKGHISLLSAPNKIRQYFEIQIHQLALYLRMEHVDESGYIINRLLSSSGKHIYLKKNGRKFLRSEDLLDKIEQVLADTTKTDSNKISELQTQINEFSIGNELANLVPFIKEIRLYQKLILHQLSHGHTGLPTFTQREVDTCLNLMIQLDNALNSAFSNIYEV